MTHLKREEIITCNNILKKNSVKYNSAKRKEHCTRQPKEQLVSIKCIEVSDIGFICTGGFGPTVAKGAKLITGEDLYALKF